MVELNHIPFVQAANEGGVRDETSLVVIHSAECPETATAAEGVAAWFTNPAAGSTHYTVDVDSTVQSVPLERVCWGAGEGPTNGIAVQIEQAGYGDQGREGWLDPYSKATITNAAALTKALLDVYPHIRPIRLTPEQLRAGERNGIVGHVDVHQAWPTGDARTDPGAEYPWDVFLGMLTNEPTGGDLAAFYTLLAELEDAMQNRVRVAKADNADTVFTLDPYRLEKHAIARPEQLRTLQFLGMVQAPPARFPAVQLTPDGVEILRPQELDSFTTV